MAQNFRQSKKLAQVLEQKRSMSDREISDCDFDAAENSFFSQNDDTAVRINI